MTTVTICTHVLRLCNGLMKYEKWVMISPLATKIVIYDFNLMGKNAPLLKLQMQQWGAILSIIRLYVNNHRKLCLCRIKSAVFLIKHIFICLYHI